MSKVFKLMVVSSKSFEEQLKNGGESYEDAYSNIDIFLAGNGCNIYNVMVCSRGEDHKTGIGECYAVERGIRRKVFRPNWAQYGRKSGSVRDRIMAKEASAIIVFWDGGCSKVNRVISIANRLKIPIRIIDYTEKD